MNKIRLALVDDDSLITTLLKDFFDKNEAIEVLLTADSGEEFLDQLKDIDQIPDVVVLDLQMKELQGTDVTKILKSDYPTIDTIVMSSHYRRSFMGFMLKAGVSAFIPKGISPNDLTQIIYEVHEKGYYFLADQVDALSSQIASNAPAPAISEQDRLSSREIEVLKLICHQKTAKEIAEELFLSQRTVEGHKNRLLAKTGAKNTAGLVIYAIQHQHIDPKSILFI